MWRFKQVGQREDIRRLEVSLMWRMEQVGQEAELRWSKVAMTWLISDNVARSRIGTRPPDPNRGSWLMVFNNK
ncbi:hypothetical protein V2J09_004374 [Rumex salicifolius]